MAVYIPPARRKRRVLLTGIIALLVGVLAGFGLGRATAPGIDEAVAMAADKGADAQAALSRLPIHYGQALRGEDGESPAKMQAAVDEARSKLERAYEVAPWLTNSVRQRVTSTVDRVAHDVKENANAEQFQRDITTAVSAIADAFGGPTP